MNWRRAPSHHLFKKRGRRFYLGVPATLSVKTTIPPTPKTLLRGGKQPILPGLERKRRPWKHSYEILTRYGAKGWETVAKLTNPARPLYCFEDIQPVEGDLFKLRVTDWAGNQNESDTLRIEPLCSRK